MSEKDFFKKLQEQVLTGKSEEIRKTVETLLDRKISALKAIDTISQALLEVGNKYDNGELFLTDLILSGDTAKTAMKMLLRVVPKDQIKKIGTIVIGTVQGDIHDLGKNIVIALLEAEGFEVHDLGVDVPIAKFIEEAEAVDADFVMVSALMSTTMPMMKQLVDAFTEVGLRDKYQIIIGGCPTSEEFAQEIGADGYAPDARKAAQLALKLIKK